MNDVLQADILKATHLTRAGRVAEATALLQQVMRRRASSAGTSGSAVADADWSPSGLSIDGVSERLDETGPSPSAPSVPSDPTRRGDPPAALANDAARPHLPQLPKALRGLLGRLDPLGACRGLGGLAKPFQPTADLVPPGGQFILGSYSNGAGTRAFKLYLPSSYRGQALPLIVMLHGCTQSPDDFAAGTRMNLLAEENSCFVVYPEQSAVANASKCWNWFHASDQQRGEGEPSLIAGITRQIMRDYAVDPRRVFVAGLSAGAAAAAILGTAYPDLYAAIGVHSGLACGAASDLPSAFAAMRQGDAAAALFSVHSAGSRDREIVPTIVFHGDQDPTVHPRNGDQVISQSLANPVGGLQKRVEHGQVPGGYAYSRSIHTDANGRTLVEQWVIRGLGHAWSGGSPGGSYTDPRGPDATREMIRFFLNCTDPTSAGPALRLDCR